MMAGIFGDEINNREDFFRELRLALEQHENLPVKYRTDPTIVAVGRQLEAISNWTRDGKTPSRADRRLVVMGYQMHRAYENTDDSHIYDFQQCLDGVNSYIKFWPTDVVASDENNDAYIYDDL